MERKKPAVKEAVIIPEVKKDDRPLWRKTGRKSMRLSGKIIKPGQRFRAYPSEIPEAFRDLVECLDKEEVARIEKEVVLQETKVEELYEIRPAKGVGWFDVVNIVSEKPINTKSLRKADAEELLQSLNTK
jgi:hypothetical protein